jgi:hypothetical protein
VSVESQESERSCICMLGVPSQESERSCICVLGVPSQESERSCICMLGVPSQESERSCICMLGISILSLHTLFQLDFGTVLTMGYLFSFSMYCWSSLDATEDRMKDC